MAVESERERTAITTAIRILECLSDLELASVREIAKAVGVSKSTVGHQLQILARAGAVHKFGQDKQGRYTVTFKLLELGATKRNRWTVYADGKPIADALAEATGGHASVVSIDGPRLARLYTATDGPVETARHAEPADRPLHAIDERYVAGSAVAPHATAPGKALLSALPAERVRDFLDTPLPSYTDRTITDRGALAAALDRIEDRGVAVADRERYPDRWAVAAPVPDRRPDFAHAVSVSLPADAHTPDRRDDLLERVREAAEAFDIDRLPVRGGDDRGA